MNSKLKEELLIEINLVETEMYYNDSYGSMNMDESSEYLSSLYKLLKELDEES